MKHGKKPNVKQMKYMASKKLNPVDWFVVKDTPNEMVVVHRNFDTVIKTIRKTEGDG